MFRSQLECVSFLFFIKSLVGGLPRYGILNQNLSNSFVILGKNPISHTTTTTTTTTTTKPHLPAESIRNTNGKASSVGNRIELSLGNLTGF
mmetsp:Transcript_38115/g.56167  ORF Transcript_38115/g.56167 Transcript_38115/m.56167 type:complete len:91 (-) Transcript_38115:433-705(-)